MPGCLLRNPAFSHKSLLEPLLPVNPIPPKLDIFELLNELAARKDLKESESSGNCPELGQRMANYIRSLIQSGQYPEQTTLFLALRFNSLCEGAVAPQPESVLRSVMRKEKPTAQNILWPDI